ncbi:phage protein [Actinobacillus seminis]|uniref:Phage protein n=1 Tax=Actinobacillus seminis TaxID=722 RepID=A0A380VEU0_9PAST|nr:phage protein [Actinobacillus seminis]
MALGKTLQEIDQLPERELSEWEIFYQEQPFGLWREDYRTAQISHLLAAIHRDPKQKATTLTDLMPFFNNKSGSENDEDDEDDGSVAYLANR